MTGRNFQPQNYRRRGGDEYSKYRRPFWLPASNYYILSFAVALVFFFLVWGLLHEESDDMAYVPAGLGASLLLIGAVFLREVVLRKARNRYLLAERRLDYNLNNISLHRPPNQNPNKLTLEQNAAIIGQIRKKSEAAQILGKLSDGHWEVFEMCNQYLGLNEKEIQTVGVGSPRLAGLRRGKEIVGQLHKFHLLAWAEIESRALTQEAKNNVTISEKLKTAQKALTVLDSALQFYPNEVKLLESEIALREFAASIKISHRLEQAERAAFQGNNKRAISHYRDALFFLARENVREEEKEIIAEKINTEIAKLREISAKSRN
ncbi:MAG TPA: hypothetical protein PKE69_16750 [Pyrinomonadaceae bacterium]|nr:hypothetical protein [Pyrinomonadaceae bacterium]